MDRRRRGEGHPPEGFTRKSEILAAHCEAVGTDFDAITGQLFERAVMPALA